MKKVLMGLFIVFIGLNASSQKLSIKNLVGSWETPDGVGLEIIDSSRIFIVYGVERKPILSYQADFGRIPFWFDFVVKDSAQNLSTLKSLLLLQSDGNLKWQVFDGGDRPSNFISNRGDIVILRRKR